MSTRSSLLNVDTTADNPYFVVRTEDDQQQASLHQTPIVTGSANARNTNDAAATGTSGGEPSVGGGGVGSTGVGEPSGRPLSHVSPVLSQVSV